MAIGGQLTSCAVPVLEDASTIAHLRLALARRRQTPSDEVDREIKRLLEEVRKEMQEIRDRLDL